MRWCVALSLIALVTAGCEDDPRDLDHLKPKPIVAPDAGSLDAPDATGAPVVPATAVDAAGPPSDAASAVDADAEDAG